MFKKIAFIESLSSISSLIIGVYFAVNIVMVFIAWYIKQLVFLFLPQSHFISYRDGSLLLHLIQITLSRHSDLVQIWFF